MLYFYESRNHSAVSCLGNFGRQTRLCREGSDFGDDLLDTLRCLDISTGGLEAGSLHDEAASLGDQLDDGSVEPINVLTNLIKRTSFHLLPFCILLISYMKSRALTGASLSCTVIAWSPRTLPRGLAGADRC